MSKLRELKDLKLITDELKRTKDRKTRTKLRRELDLSENRVRRAISLGVERGCLSEESHGYINLDGPFNIIEEDFYPAVEKSLAGFFDELGYETSEYVVEKTARRDSRIVGRWTRPDFTVVSHKKYPWTIGSEFDVMTFEVKRPDNCNVLAVFEALAHSAVATRAFVVFPVNIDDWEKSHAAQHKRVSEECSRHGVGFLTLENAYSKPYIWKVLDSRRVGIDLSKVSDFLNAVLSEDGKRRISVWK